MVRELNDERISAVALDNLGAVMHGLGERDAARDLLEESLALSREVGYLLGVANALTDLGMLMLIDEDHTAARPLLAEALEIRRAMDDRLGIARCLVGLAAVVHAVGRPEPAARLLGAAAALLRAIGAVVPPIDRAVTDHTLAAIRDVLGPDRLAAAQAAGAALPVAQAVAEALAMGVGPT
jgi:tetratricopeptide (TPR) repeat protein